MLAINLVGLHGLLNLHTATIVVTISFRSVTILIFLEGGRFSTFASMYND